MNIRFSAILVLLVLGLGLASCGGAQKDDGDASSNKAEQAEGTNTPADDNNGLPKFQNPLVNNFVADFAEYGEKYGAALKANDQDEIIKLNERGIELTNSSREMIKLLKPDEMTKFNTFITDVAMKISEAVSAGN